MLLFNIYLIGTYTYNYRTYNDKFCVNSVLLYVSLLFIYFKVTFVKVVTYKGLLGFFLSLISPLSSNDIHFCCFKYNGLP